MFKSIRQAISLEANPERLQPSTCNQTLEKVVCTANFLQTESEKSISRETNLSKQAFHHEFCFVRTHGHEDSLKIVVRLLRRPPSRESKACYPRNFLPVKPRLTSQEV